MPQEFLQETCERDRVEFLAHGAYENEALHQMITVSIITHGHSAMMAQLLRDLIQCPEVTRIVLTHNMHEAAVTIPEALASKVVNVNNLVPKGFGANHNAAFRHCQTHYFCVLNPDIRLLTNPFPVLLPVLKKANAGAVAPVSVNAQGVVEDSVRYFPRPRSLAAKALGLTDGSYRSKPGAEAFAADWVGGMFMLFRSADFKAIHGFDEKYFLYYEDVDICARLWKAHRRVFACPQVTVVHNAQRASRRDLRHLRWHLQSMTRYFRKYLFRLPVAK